MCSLFADSKPAPRAQSSMWPPSGLLTDTLRGTLSAQCPLSLQVPECGLPPRLPVPSRYQGCGCERLSSRRAGSHVCQVSGGEVVSQY